MTVAAEDWSRTFGNVPALSVGDSLAGVTLTLDADNGMRAGDTLICVSRHATGIARTARPGPVLFSRAFDLKLLASLTGLTGGQVESLTAIGAARAFLGSRARYATKALGQRAGYALCPRCAHRRRIPLVTLFAATEACAEHRLMLQSSCGCGASVQPFAGQEPWCCHGCREPYRSSLRVVLLTADEGDRCRRLTRIQEELLDAGRYGPRLSERAIGAALRHLLLLSQVQERRRAGLLRRSSARKLSLSLIVAVLAETETSTALFLALARDLTQPVPRGLTRPGHCPNPVCRSRSTWSRGRAAWGEREWVCRACGTRFTIARTLFSFDPQPGYPAWRALRNARRLTDLRSHLDRAEIAHPKETEAARFRRVGVPRSLSYFSDRAGLTTMPLRGRGTSNAAA